MEGNNVYIMRSVRLDSSMVASYYTYSNGVIDSSSSLNGFPFSPDGPPEVVGDMVYQKVGYGGQNYNYPIEAGSSVEVFQITVNQPSISAGDFAIDENPPILTGTPAFTHTTGEVWVSGTCNLIISDVDAPVETTDNLNIVFYPNPTQSKVFMHLKSESKETGAVSIYDQMGRLVRKQEFIAHAGGNEISLSVKGFSAGAYFAKVVLEGRVFNHWIVVED